MPHPDDAARLNALWETLDWEARLNTLAGLTGRIVFSTSLGLEDQIITERIAATRLPVSPFTIDTGRLFPEAYALHAETEARYGLAIATFFPRSDAVEAYTREDGVNGFYHSVESRHRCCHIRKVEPLGRALEGADYWISGLRRAHSSSRAELPFAEHNAAQDIVKLYPVLDMDDATLRNIIKTRNIPYNPLFDKGFPSIGCAPCTRAVAAGEDPRSGRWWWENESKRECGLHFENGKLVRAGGAHA